MRKLSIAFVVLLLLAECVGQQSKHAVKLAGCVMNVNGEFHLLTPARTYILKGEHDTLLGYSGKQVEVKGTVDAASNSSPQGAPVVLHVTSLKKVADFCQ